MRENFSILSVVLFCILTIPCEALIPLSRDRLVEMPIYGGKSVLKTSTNSQENNTPVSSADPISEDFVNPNKDKLIKYGLQEDSIELYQWLSVLEGISIAELSLNNKNLDVDIDYFYSWGDEIKKIDNSIVGLPYQAVLTDHTIYFREDFDINQFESIKMALRLSGDISVEEMGVFRLTIEFEDEKGNLVEAPLSYSSGKFLNLGLDLSSLINAHPEFDWANIRGCNIKVYSDDKRKLLEFDGNNVHLDSFIFIPKKESGLCPLSVDSLITSLRVSKAVRAFWNAQEIIKFARDVDNGDEIGIASILENELGEKWDGRAYTKMVNFLIEFVKALHPDIVTNEKALDRAIYYLKLLYPEGTFCFKYPIEIHGFKESDTEAMSITRMTNDVSRLPGEYIIKVDYDIDKISDRENPSRNYLWLVDNIDRDFYVFPLDLANFDSIHFWIRGDGEKGHCEEIKLEMSDETYRYSVGRRSTDIYIPVTDEWEEYCIPLNFDTMSLGYRTNGLRWKNIQQIVISVEGSYSRPKGTFYLADIVLEKKIDLDKLKDVSNFNNLIEKEGFMFPTRIVDIWFKNLNENGGFFTLDEKLSLIFRLSPEIKKLYPEIQLGEELNMKGDYYNESPYVSDEVVKQSISICAQIVKDIEDKILNLMKIQNLSKDEALKIAFEKIVSEIEKMVPLRQALEKAVEEIGGFTSIKTGLQLDWEELKNWRRKLTLAGVSVEEEQEKLGDEIINLETQARQRIFAQESIPQAVHIPKQAWRIGVGDVIHSPAEGVYIDYGINNGAPLGTLSGGAIQRSYNGDFNLWHLNIGSYVYDEIPANQFSIFVKGENNRNNFAQVLNPGGPTGPHQGELSSWNWGYPRNAAAYYALYPRAWTVYNHPNLPVKLAVEQLSPLIPENYLDSALPVGVFVWTVENDSKVEQTVSVMFSWENMVGWNVDNFKWGKSEGNYNYLNSDEKAVGIIMRGPYRQATDEMEGEFAILVGKAPGVEVSYNTRFNTQGEGEDLWEDFSDDGSLSNIEDKRPATKGERIGSAIAVKVTLQPGEFRQIPFILVWDFPIMKFGSGEKWYQYYTKALSELGISEHPTDGHNAWEIGKYALDHYKQWEIEISRWQERYLNTNKPDYYLTSLFNQLYYLPLGSAWASSLVGKNHGKYSLFDDSSRGKFSVLENLDWRNYTPVDVRFYGSFPITVLWPEIERNVLMEIADITFEKAGIVPHDLHDPKGSPWNKSNVYSITEKWIDLAPKFVLMAYRDFLLDSEDIDFLRNVWPAVKLAMERLRRVEFDKNQNGLPEHKGSDSTYDTWDIIGESSYEAFLMLAALKSCVKMAEILGDDIAEDKYQNWFEAVREIVEDRLWNGQYFVLSYDPDTGEMESEIMADALAGQWYANILGLGDLVAKEKIISTLQYIYENNFLKSDGGIGAVNGVIKKDASIFPSYRRTYVDWSSEQSDEVWFGVNYALASLFMHYGMEKEAKKLLETLYELIYQRGGLWFRVPEAVSFSGFGDDIKLIYRGTTYYRPLSIWSLELIDWK